MKPFRDLCSYLVEKFEHIQNHQFIICSDSESRKYNVINTDGDMCLELHIDGKSDADVLLYVNVPESNPNVFDTNNNMVACKRCVNNSTFRDVVSWWCLTFPHVLDKNMVQLVNRMDFKVQDEITFNLSDDAEVFQQSTIHEFDTDVMQNLIGLRDEVQDLGRVIRMFVAVENPVLDRWDIILQDLKREMEQ